jgi:hypothetical protein
LDANGFRSRYCMGALARLYDRMTADGQWVSLPGESMRRREVQP